MDAPIQSSASDTKERTHRLTFAPSPKRIRAIAHAKTIADSLCAGLLLETGQRPVYYFHPDDVRTEWLKPVAHRTTCPYKGEASYWALETGGIRIENAAWSYREPLAAASNLKGLLAFDWKKIDHWFEEDEEIFGHPRDPYHRVDVRASTREVRVVFAGETIAETRRGLFLFETGMPTRYYIPPQDVASSFLTPTRRRTICPYKGRASYWSIKVGDRVAEDAVWSYAETLPECPRIHDYFCFYPEKVDRIEVEGESAKP